MIDTYNQQIQYDVSCTIRTNINTANHHFIVEECNSKENILPPTKVSTGTQHKSSFEDNLGGISRTVKTDDSLAVMEEVKIAAMQGRNPDNPSERGKNNGNYQQRLEENESGTSNTITSVQKDNLVIEPQVMTPKRTEFGNQYARNMRKESLTYRHAMTELTPHSKTRRGRVGKQMANTLTTSCNQGVVVSEPKAVSYSRDSKGKTQNKHLNEIVNTIHSSTGSGGNTDCFIAEPKVQQIGNIYPDKEGFKNRTAGRIFSADGLSPTLRTMSGGHQEPKIETHYRIRKLTPRECFRLMGCDEETIDIIQAAGISNSQQYKLAGNSIVVDVLYHLFRKMFVETENESQQLTLF